MAVQELEVVAWNIFIAGHGVFFFFVLYSMYHWVFSTVTRLERVQSAERVFNGNELILDNYGLGTVH